MKTILSISVFLTLLLNVCTAQKALFKAMDFTGEGLFSQNIEGPAFDVAGNLYVVNFGRDGIIGKIDHRGVGEVFVELPEPSIANAIQFDQAGQMYLADFMGHNILRVNMQTKAIEAYVHDERFNQPNDICINKRDQLFASDPSWKNSTGQLWRIDPPGKAVLLDGNMGTTNGIELSPDEKLLYVNESVQRKVWVFDVDPSGQVSNKRLFTQFDDFGMDGMKCDKKGNLYITRHGKGTIAVFNPQGQLIREVKLKGKSCSNLVFGGPNGTIVFVTLQDRGAMEYFHNDIPGKNY